MIGMSHPGLVSREVIAVDGNIATVREVWDLKAPGCPMVAYRLSPSWQTPGSTIFEHDETAVLCERTVDVPLGDLDV